MSGIWSVLLAGGNGSRLSQLTRLASGETVPKQFCSLSGPVSLLSAALTRALNVSPPERIVAVVAAGHRHWWRADLESLPHANVLVQPVNRGTAPALLLALREIWRRDRDAVVLVVPTDHWVEHEWKLTTALHQAVRLAAERPKRVLLIGSIAEAPEPGYGWIVPAKTRGTTRVVRAFVEKPGVEETSKLFAQGALINTFLFAARVATLLELFETHLPALSERFRRLPQPRSGHLAPLFRDIERHDFSHEVLARSVAALTVLIASGLGWTDLGTPERVAACLAHSAPRSTGSHRNHGAPLELARAVNAGGE